MSSLPLSSAFRLLALGQGLSWFGDAFAPIALAVAVVVGGGSASELGLVLAATMTARLAGTLVGGVWADRVAPGRIMVASDVVRALAALATAGYFASGQDSALLLCGLAAVTGGAAAFFGPAFVSLRPLLVPVERRHAANATLNILQNSAFILGPATAGVFVAWAGAPWAFVVNAVSFLVSAATVAAIRVEAPRAPRVGMLAELREGWREVTSRSWLLAGLLAATAYHAAFGAVTVLVDVIAVRDLGGPTALGWISAASGAGGLLGGLLALRMPPSRPLFVGWPCVALMSLFAAAFAWPGHLGAVIAAAVVAFGGLMYFSVCWDTALQDGVPHAVLARVSSWDILTSFVAIPAGNALAGPIAHTYGTSRVILVAAVVMALASLAPMLVRGSRELRRATTATPAPEPTATPERTAVVP
ncbi:Predicted arabinose efflux permease, MFS family [Pedococcus dokdonensis]|uniref:Predicted arabinose efflux permease, MFS family n=1 Tax=Pedococcus dokdonensis TaxID=443156 RepID=A0A1H0KKZ8_9MICO|nr:MFS transporter [Pedococcus dokdonensis]SDO56493.1 Predicted arabinose efflux permease, MFS family [Pedococcus dokdonensis]